MRLVEKQASDESGLRHHARQDIDWTGHQLIQYDTHAGQLLHHIMARGAWGSTGEELRLRLVVRLDGAMGWATSHWCILG